MEKELLRPDEAAIMLRVSRWTIYRWIAEGTIDGVKIGRKSLRVYKSSIDRLLNNGERKVSSY